MSLRILMANHERYVGKDRSLMLVRVFLYPPRRTPGGYVPDWDGGPACIDLEHALGARGVPREDGVAIPSLGIGAGSGIGVVVRNLSNAMVTAPGSVVYSAAKGLGTAAGAAYRPS